MNEIFCKQFQTALDLRTVKRYKEASEVLLLLSKDYPESASVHAILGQVYWELDYLYPAIESFKKAIQLSPTSELASLGLYHALLDAECDEEAQKEKDRFEGK